MEYVAECFWPGVGEAELSALDERARASADALVEQGYPAWFSEIRDGHTWTCWRDTFYPHLPALIEAVV